MKAPTRFAKLFMIDLDVHNVCSESKVQVKHFRQIHYTVGKKTHSCQPFESLISRKKKKKEEDRIVS